MRTIKKIQIVNIAEISEPMMEGKNIILIWTDEKRTAMRGIIAEGEKTKHITGADNKLFHGIVRPNFGGKTAKERIKNFLDYTGGIELQ